MKSVVASSRSNGSNVTVSTLSQANTGLTEHDYIGLSEVSSSSQTSEYSHRPNEKEAQEADGGFGETELKLGLSLTASGSYSKDAPALGFSNAEKTFQWVCSQDNGVEQEKSSYPPVKGSEKRVSQEEYQRASVQGGWPRGFEQWISQDRACSVWQNQVLRAREGARILTAQDLQAPAPLPSSMGQDVVEGLRSGFGFSNSGRVIIPPMAGTKRVHNDSVGSEGLQDSSAIPKGQVVGWPPIKQYRSKTLASPPKPPGDDQEDVIQASKSVQNQGNSLYVKVNMDGVPIGRKVDLNAHDSYETLALALEDMFQRSNNNSQSGAHAPLEKGHGGANDTKRSRLLDSSSDYVLTYEDKEGDWMLVGDVPWRRMFVNTVKRLKIMKTSEANGLASRCPEKMNRQKSKAL